MTRPSTLRLILNAAALVGLADFGLWSVYFQGHVIIRKAQRPPTRSYNFWTLEWRFSRSRDRVRLLVCMCLLLQYLLVQSCSRAGRGIVQDMCSGY